MTSQDTTKNLQEESLNKNIIDSSDRAKYTPAHIANYFLERFFSENIPIDHLKLQKLIYIGYGWYLAFCNKKLFDEPILAWKLGPVSPSIYYYYRSLNNIPKGLYVGVFDSDEAVAGAPKISPNDNETLAVLDLVFKQYKDKSAIELVKILHNENSPWDKVYRDGLGKNLPLNDEDIKARATEKILELYGDTEGDQVN